MSRKKDTITYTCFNRTTNTIQTTEDLQKCKILSTPHTSIRTFYKLDSTESTPRMHPLLMIDNNGHEHKDASNRHKILNIKQPDLITLKVPMRTESMDEEDTMIENKDSDEIHSPTEDSFDKDEEKNKDKMDDIHSEIDDDIPNSPPISNNCLLTHTCTMITPMYRYIGIMKLFDTYLTFDGISNEHDDKKKSTSVKHKNLIWMYKSIRAILPRCYLLRESALEIFLSSFKNFFFHFTPPDVNHGDWNSIPIQSINTIPKHKRSGRTQRNEIYKLLCTLCNQSMELNAGKRLWNSSIMKKWQRGQISNFDYLQHLNTLAGRTYNDINQYPVFPWILIDYTSDTIDLNDISIYRDLSKPIGALNVERFQIYKERYETFEDDSIPPFFYGK
jgi:hypothetical protein